MRFTDGTLDVDNYPEFSYSHSSSTVVCFSVCNVALNRPSYQSSAHYRGDPRHGNDGTWMNLTAWPDPRCTHSWRETNPWWGVDLGVPLTVREIFLTNRLEISTGELTLHLSCSARAKRTLFSAKSARTLTHFFYVNALYVFLTFSFTVTHVIVRLCSLENLKCISEL